MLKKWEPQHFTAAPCICCSLLHDPLQRFAGMSTAPGALCGERHISSAAFTRPALAAGWKDETILATLYEDPDHLQGPYPGWDPNLHFVASHDFFASDHEKIAPCGNQFEILAHKVTVHS